MSCIKRVKLWLMPVILMSLTGSAQDDSLSFPEIWLREVTIQSAEVSLNNHAHRSDKDVVQSTDAILSTLKGVNVIKRGNYAWEPAIRGLSAGRISTTIDGMAIFGACTDKMDPVSSYIEPNNLSSIAVNYSAGGANTTNSIGGGFDFRLHQPGLSPKPTLGGMAGSGYETNGNAFQTFGNFSYSSEKIGINVNGIYRVSGNYRSGAGIVNFSQYEKWNGGIGLLYKISGKSRVVVNYIRDEGYNIGYPALPMDVLYARASIASVEHRLYPENKALTRWSNKLYYNFIDHAMDDTQRPAETISMHMDMPGTSETAGYNSDAEWQFGKHRLRTVYKGYLNRLHAEMTMYPADGSEMFMLTLPDAERQNHQVSATANFHLSDPLTLETGIGSNLIFSAIFSEAGQQTLEGSLGALEKRHDVLYSLYLQPAYQIRPQLTALLNAGFTSRVATLQELYGFFLYNIADGYDYIGNPALEKEHSVNVDAGVQWQTKNIRAEAKSFIYLIENYISGVVDDTFDAMTMEALGVKQYRNLDGATLQGLELNAIFTTENFTLETQNSWTYGTDHKGRALPGIPPLRSVSRLQYYWKKFRLTPEVILNAAQKHVSRAEYGETPSPGFAVVNLLLDRNFKMGKTEFCINTGVTNIFDIAYYNHTDVMQVLNPGRSVFLRMSAHF